MNKIYSFTDLEAWKKGHALVLMIYKITIEFPPSEQFGLTNQLRRATVSITSNIAEGFSKRTAKDKRKFFRDALGSLTETQNQLLIARDVGFLKPQLFQEAAQLSVYASKLINGLLKTAMSASHT